MITRVRHSEDITVSDLAPEEPDLLCSGEFVGDIVRYLREERGVSARDLSKQAKISSMQLWRIEQKKASPTEETIRKLACALEVSAARLFGVTVAKNDVASQEVEVELDHAQQRLSDIQRQVGDIQQQLNVLDRELDSASKGTRHQSEAVRPSGLIWGELPHDEANPKFTAFCIDTVGRLAEITDVFKKAQVNILTLTAIGNEGALPERDIKIWVPRTRRSMLQHIGESLLRIDGVVRVEVEVRSPVKK